MKIFVTGAAGFIGSHLCEKLLENEAHSVTGIDHLIGPTSVPLKHYNVKGLNSHPRFRLIEDDLLSVDLHALLKDVDVIYHLAGIPGVRSSWGTDFDPYVANNIIATQRLLETVKDLPIKKFIYTSTSSIYGQKSGKVSEDMLPEPLSPYGVTKLAGEHLCRLYAQSNDIPVVVLRLFTVYGPRQRPDMAFHKFIRQLLTNQPITVFGDGLQSRDFTYIGDCVKGIASIMDNDDAIGRTFNIGGKERATINEMIALLEQLTGEKAIIHQEDALPGEPKHTYANISQAETILNYHPTISLKEGLVEEVAYIRNILKDVLR
ncbi:NAD-dependent epimerase/dehydratase family protein [Bacillus solimangrovi]|uniref:UDP-glucose 4-epimerase n=1 Tax=Bacillus solimangrovi TaxID=1305675 RepID=A0A1E5LG43_9BACI|nr:NAD-dependent epimerase/dehydratase family protein [Bacillus solimangrovi]OEH93043.1 UDP-glucose 4-epimerase [Bacillus solimangrovi]